MVLSSIYRLGLGFSQLSTGSIGSRAVFG